MSLTAGAFIGCRCGQRLVSDVTRPVASRSSAAGIRCDSPGSLSELHSWYLTTADPVDSAPRLASEPAGSRPLSSAAIRCHLLSSTAIRCHPLPSSVICCQPVSVSLPARRRCSLPSLIKAIAAAICCRASERRTPWRIPAQGSAGAAPPVITPAALGQCRRPPSGIRRRAGPFAKCEPPSPPAGRLRRLHSGLGPGRPTDPARRRVSFITSPVCRGRTNHLCTAPAVRRTISQWTVRAADGAGRASRQGGRPSDAPRARVRRPGPPCHGRAAPQSSQWPRAAPRPLNRRKPGLQERSDAGGAAAGGRRSPSLRGGPCRVTGVLRHSRCHGRPERSAVSGARAGRTRSLGGATSGAVRRRSVGDIELVSPPLMVLPPRWDNCGSTPHGLLCSATRLPAATGHASTVAGKIDSVVWNVRH